MARWSNAVPAREELFGSKRKALVREAARAFSRSGSHGTTLDDVAERLGVTKTALYYYVQNKNDLLFACHQEAMAIANENVDAGEAKGRTGLDKIQIGMTGYLTEMIGTMGVPLMILEDNALTGEQATEIVALRDAFEERLRRLVQEGIGDGSIVALNAKLAVFCLLGAIHWVTKWYSSEGRWTAEETAEALVELSIRGWKPDSGGRLESRIHHEAP